MPYNYFGYNAYNQYMPTGYNPYLQNQQRPQEQYQPTQPNQPMQFQRPAGIQGKIVDNMDVVKAIEIPLDGSTSYFPLADNSAIITRQLQQDGTSKTTIYKPVIDEGKQETTKYITENDLKAQFGDLNPKDIKDIKEEIKALKKRIRELTDDIEEKKGE